MRSRSTSTMTPATRSAMPWSPSRPTWRTTRGRPSPVSGWEAWRDRDCSRRLSGTVHARRCSSDRAITVARNRSLGQPAVFAPDRRLVGPQPVDVACRQAAGPAVTDAITRYAQSAYALAGCGAAIVWPPLALLVAAGHMVALVVSADRRTADAP